MYHQGYEAGYVLFETDDAFSSIYTFTSPRCVTYRPACIQFVFVLFFFRFHQVLTKCLPPEFGIYRIYLYRRMRYGYAHPYQARHQEEGCLLKIVCVFPPGISVTEPMLKVMPVIHQIFLLPEWLFLHMHLRPFLLSIALMCRLRRWQF